MLELLSLVSPLLILNVIACLFKSKQKVQHTAKLQEICTEMFTLPLKAFKTLNHSSMSIAQSAVLPQSQSPFSICANKFDFGRTMCTFPRQAKRV